MKIKTATLIGLIGAITSLVVSLYFLAYNTGIISFFVDTLDFFPLFFSQRTILFLTEVAFFLL